MRTVWCRHNTAGARPERASSVYAQRAREAFPGVPIVLGYTAFIYRVFRGKVRLGPESY